MRGVGQFQIDQMKKGDPRVPQLFRTLRTALALLEDIITHPHSAPPIKPAPSPNPVPPPVPVTVEEKLAYSIKEVRKLTGLSNATIYARIKEGKLKSTKTGSRTLILAPDLRAWMDSWHRR